LISDPNRTRGYDSGAVPAAMHCCCTGSETRKGNADAGPPTDHDLYELIASGTIPADALLGLLMNKV
jgi:hypothetical protein